MKYPLLATVAVLAMATPAHAQIPVTDGASITARALEAARSLKQGLQQLQQMQAQYQQAVTTYNAIAHATDLGGVVSALGGVSRSYLPPNSAITEGLSAVQGGIYGGVPGALSGAERFLGSNQLYATPGTPDAWQTEQNRRSMVTANAQALAAESMAEADQRLANLAFLRARLEAAKDGTEVAAVNGLIAIEQQNLAIHQARFQNISAMVVADNRVTDQRQEQRQRQSADELKAMTAPITGSLR
ncbi:type IV secretion system protein [Roseomonas chloroacetimidivorans]|uniref:type IV secretion system protein n=1 Tax=Roseomonas chloroacetimidivorans TaxID=1766656 RepID=UPI003C780C76